MFGYGVCDSWVSQLQDDCDFMWHSVEAVQIDLPDPRVHFSEWVYSFRDGDKPWKAIIFKACGVMFAALCKAPAPLPGNDDDEIFACTDCSAVFRSRQRLFTHKFNVHHYVNHMRLRVYTSLCCVEY